MFDTLRASVLVRKLLRGIPVKLSDAQIACININLYDANQNLTREQYEDFIKLYMQIRKRKTKRLYAFYPQYERRVLDIIEEFETIAPHNLYSDIR